MLAPIGLFLTFIGVVISFIGWLLMIKDAVEEKAGLDVKGLIFYRYNYIFDNLKMKELAITHCMAQRG